MTPLKNDRFTIQARVVADLQKKAEAAPPVVNAPTNAPAPRVDGTSTIAPSGFSGGGAVTPSELKKIATGAGAVDVGRGGGVLGLLLNKATAVPDPEKLGSAELQALLTPYFGKAVVVTSYDRDEASSLTAAAKSHSIGDTRGVLVGVSDEGLQLQKDGKTETLRSEFWAVARIRLDGDERKVIAQDPHYPQLFTD